MTAPTASAPRRLDQPRAVWAVAFSAPAGAAGSVFEIAGT